MKITLVLTLFCLSFIYPRNVYCQLNDSLSCYYNLVNIAELHIVDSNYRNAYNSYQSAFRYIENSFKKDIYNQAICATLIYKYGKTYSNLKTLLNYGYNLDSLKKRNELKGFFGSRYGNKLVRHSRKGIALFNVDLRTTYDSLYTVDQLFRLKPGGYEMYGDTISKIDISNVEKVLSLINIVGFPSEDIIGVYDRFDYLPIKIIILHNNVGGRFQNFDFTEIVYNAVIAGKLDSRVALELLAGSSGNDRYGFDLSGVVRHGLEASTEINNKVPELTNWGFYKISNEKENEYDSIRAQIGLCSLVDSRIKAIYCLNDQRFYLTGPSSQKNFFWSLEEDYKDALKNTIFIE